MRRARVIVNPAAGSGRTARRWPAIARALAAADVEVDAVFTDGPGHARVLAAAAVAQGAAQGEGAGGAYDCVVAVGGDGTANEVLNGLLTSATPLPLGIVQTGTGRDLARLIGDPGDIRRQARIVGRGHVEHLDVGWATYTGSDGPQRRAFVIVAGTGFTAGVIQRVGAWKRWLREASYLAAALRTLWGVRPISGVITLDGVEQPGRVVECLVANAPWSGGGLRLAPGASAQDGRLNVVLVGDAGRVRLLSLLLRSARGGHVGRRGVLYRPVEAVTCTADPPILVALDGELVGRTPVTYAVAAAALPVLTEGVRSG